jgi:tRNA threonylcarbamoyladenosine biosynthesis protein TsaB
MALILNIDTAIETASISLAQDGKVILFATNESKKDHAAWIQPAIRLLMEDSEWTLQNLNAVAVTIGPGSYTGLRIGLSAAKGLCYALKIPLITVGTLEVMAFSGIKDAETSTLQSLTPDSRLSTPDLLFCPMIDAKRLEVFTAVYNSSLYEVVKPHALILNPLSFEELLKGYKILFLGNGSIKFQKICQNAHAMFKKIALNPVALAALTYRNFIGNNFAGLAYTEPLYLKEFFAKDREPGKTSFN